MTMRMAYIAAIMPLMFAVPPALADPNGDAGVCNDQCTRDSNGNFESCHRMCMSQRELYNNTPNEPMRPMPRLPTLYGAIATDSGTLATGYGKDYPTRADAERRAIALCRRAGGSAAGCKVAIWGHNRCLALASSRSNKPADNVWGYSWSDDGWVARKKAMSLCQNEGGRACKVAVSLCTG